MDILKKHRVIGIRHCLGHFKARGLVSQGVNYPAAAAAELVSLRKKAITARRHRSARANASPQSIIATVAAQLGLPKGAILIVYPSGRKFRSDSNMAALRRSWAKHKK